MKKKLLLLAMGLILVSCGGGNSSNQSNDPVSSGSQGTTSSEESTSDSSTQPVDGYELKSHEYIFTDVLDNFTNAYVTTSLKCDGDGFNFMHGSHQSSSISTVPVIDASKEEKTYVTLLSEAPYDLSRIGMSITLFSNGDVANIASDYYIGMEYLHDGTWQKASNSLDKSSITVGALQNEDDIFYFNVNRSGVRKIRMAFECEAVNNENKIRFGIYSMFIEGQSKIIETNQTTTSININEPASNKILTSGQVQLSATVAASNGLATPVLWTSSDRYVATIDENGLVKGVTTGEVTLTATSGTLNDTFLLSVVNDLSIDSYIQPTVTLNDIDNLPQGFTTDLIESYADALKFQKTGEYLLTPKYTKVNGETKVTLRMKLYASADEAIHNIFAVAGLDDQGEVLEEKTVVGHTNTDYSDVSFAFTNTNIVQYKIYYKYKYEYDNGIYTVTGKNYAVQSLEIVKL